MSFIRFPRTSDTFDIHIWGIKGVLMKSALNVLSIRCTSRVHKKLSEDDKVAFRHLAWGVSMIMMFSKTNTKTNTISKLLVPFSFFTRSRTIKKYRVNLFALLINSMKN